MKLGGITGGIPWPAEGLAGPAKPLSWYIKPYKDRTFNKNPHEKSYELEIVCRIF